MGSIFAWVIFPISLLILIILIILYLQGNFSSRQLHQIHNLPVTAPNFPIAIASLTDSFLVGGEVLNFWVGSEDIFAARLAAIKNACKSIQFETFIMTPGKRADDFAQALIAKAQAGVNIQLIVDGYGTRKISHSYWNQLKAAGIEILRFNPFSWQYPTAYLQRNHRKLLLVDGKIALIGGAGVSDLWDGKDNTDSNQPWLDYEVCIRGSLISRLQGIFQQHWLDAGGLVDGHFTSVSREQQPESTMMITTGEDPTTRDAGIRALFQTFLQAANKRIWIASPYFLPDTNTRKILHQAKIRGVDIKILTMGIHNDKPPVRYASRQFYPQMLNWGVSIYEYQPSMMHAKGLIIDDDWVSLGSANFDPRSMFHNDELNISTSNRNLCKHVEQFFLDALTDSMLVTKRDLRDRSWRERIIGRLTLLLQWQL